MKKIFITAGILSAGFFFAQEGNIGINTNAPGATLDVNISPDITDATKGQGVAVPRVSKERLSKMTSDIVTSSLVYVDREKNGDTTFDDTALTATVGTVNRVARVNSIGFYYFDGTQWAKVGSGAVYQSIKSTNKVGEVETLNTLKSTDWKDGDYTFILQTGFSGGVALPDPTLHKGRVIAIRNISGNNRTIAPYTPVNNATINTNRGLVLQSDGTDWQAIGGF